MSSTSIQIFHTFPNFRSSSPSPERPSPSPRNTRTPYAKTSQDEMSGQPQQQILEQNDDVMELEEVGEIEEEVNQMAERIAKYRGTISIQLKTTVSSILTAQRPVLGTHFDDGSESQFASSCDPSSVSFFRFYICGVSQILLSKYFQRTLGRMVSYDFERGSGVGGPIESGNIALLAREEQKEAEKVEILKQKISENASAIPVVLTRMKECMKRIDTLKSCNRVIHPAFKRKRTY